MAKSCFRTLTSTRGAHDVSLLDQKRLVNFLYCTLILTYSSRNGLKPHWPTFELINNRAQNFIVHFVEAILIHIQRIQRILSYRSNDVAISFYLRKISCTTEQRIGNTRCPPAPTRNLIRTFIRNGGV